MPGTGSGRCRRPAGPRQGDRPVRRIAGRCSKGAGPARPYRSGASRQWANEPVRSMRPDR
eukprot:14743163-Alexandrium_andersonii.AAC.1